MLTHKNKQNILETLLVPLTSLHWDCINQRHCPRLSDLDWIKTGVLRVLSLERSATGFLQQFSDVFSQALAGSSFFKNLHSKRRLDMVTELNEKLVKQFALSADDPLSAFTSLNKYEVFAGDGHYREASTHQPKVGETKYAVGYFYTLNLRTRMLTHLDSMLDEPNRKREHDMHLLKRMSIGQLRQGTPKGRKVIYVWDPAGIDLLQWYRWKQGSGIYFISSLKSNMKPEPMGQKPWDKNNPINAGVISDQYVGFQPGVLLRLVHYRCPSTGKEFRFLTSVMDIEPGLIAHLYKLRWNIQKVYDELKSKLSEKKAWAQGNTARNMQALLTCLSYNLMYLLQQTLAKEENLTDNKETSRRNKQLEQLKQKLKEQGDILPLPQQAPHKPTQIGQKFIRWLRNHCWKQTSYAHAIDALRLKYT